MDGGFYMAKSKSTKRIFIGPRVYTLAPESRFITWKLLENEDVFYSAAETVRNEGVKIDGKNSMPQTLDRLAPLEIPEEEDRSSEARLSRALDRFTEGIKVNDGRNEYEEYEFEDCLVMLKDNSRIKDLCGDYHDTWCMMIHPSTGDSLKKALEKLCLYESE